MSQTREAEGTQSDVTNAPSAEVDPSAPAPFSFGRDGLQLSTLNQAAAHIVLAVGTAKQIQELEMIRLSPNFPASGLQATIRMSQMNICDQAGRFSGPIRQQMTTVVDRILQFSDQFVSLSKECFEKLKCTEETFQLDKKKLLKCLVDMKKMAKKIRDDLISVDRDIGQIVGELEKERKKLNECIEAFDKAQQEYKQKEEMIEQEQLQRRIEELRSEHGRIKKYILIKVGLAVLVGTGVTVLASVPGAAIVCFGCATGNPVLAVGGAALTGLGIISTATVMGVLTYKELFERIQRMCRLNQEIRRLQNRLNMTPRETLSYINVQLMHLLDLSHAFKNQLDNVRSDWSQLSYYIEQTTENLDKAETSTVISLIKAKLLAAEKSWQEASEWAKKIRGGCEESPERVCCNTCNQIGDLASTLRSACHDFISIA